MSRTLVQVGATYWPVAYLADKSQMRVFVGQLNPSSVAGVSLAVGDQWRYLSSGVGYGLGPYGSTPYGS